VGTREGLDVFNPGTQTFRSFRTREGLPDNNIRALAQDRDHHIWASTSNGIVRVSLVEGEGGIQGINCRSYGEQDGLQGAEFNEKSSLVTRDGHLLFGGPNGINFFHPDSIGDTKNFPPIVFTDLELYNKSVNVGDKTGGHSILQKSIIEAPEVTLNYNDNVFSIEFASLSFVTNSKAKYAYWLEGFNTTWMQADGNVRKATYTNLPPGHYTFRVRASNEDGVWNDKEARLSITILPPWWKTPLAYIAYAILFVLAVYFSRRMVIERARMRFAVEHERQEAKRIQEVDRMKIRFFTNMSHELRTPLSLILAPVERLLENPQLPEPRKQYELIRRNAKRLLFLVGQLLDFRKMETNELKLNSTRGDLLTFIREISYSFTDLAENKGIAFSYHAPAGSLYASFDHDKMERILFNLLSNAFKFTAEKGIIGVEVLVRKITETSAWLDIKVKDTGIGIPTDQQERIFEPFFQSDTPAHILNQGTGLGLAITMEYVRMHSGTLKVESEQGKGSCFIVSLLLADVVEGAELPAPIGSGSEGVADNGPERGEEGKRPTVLIVEDNEDFRFYLKDNLRAYFQILEASNGKEGWQKTLSQHPDLIVSDISMPIMNGIDFCKKVKHDERTVQIPLILLTAMASETHELVSLQTGATDYITKPFNFEVLLSKIINHIHFHETAKRTYQRQVQVSPSAVAVASADEQFLKDLLILIEKNMDNPEFSVTQLSKEFNSSRSTIYKRLLALTGKHPIEFIRHVRLKRAAELLEKTQMGVAEVAYSVGFNDPKYFTQFFKSEFGMVPSAYRTFKKQEPK
jgi:signal transduction histidine kinase/DNA-binding response OmpR family regulator